MIQVITAVYNEELLMPLFLRNYAFADSILVILDTATTDRTPEILEADPRVEIVPITYPNGLNWQIKSDTVNQKAIESKADWVMAVDADEFICPIEGFEKWLDKRNGNLVWVSLWEVYRHKDDVDIDYTKAPFNQRRHGNPVKGVSYGQPLYTKPCIVKPSSKVAWDCGIHHYILDKSPDVVDTKDVIPGVHWCMADPEIAIYRRLQQKARQSKENLDNCWGFQNHYITKEIILKECDAHLNDPLLF